MAAIARASRNLLKLPAPWLPGAKPADPSAAPSEEAGRREGQGRQQAAATPAPPDGKAAAGATRRPRIRPAASLPRTDAGGRLARKRQSRPAAARRYDYLPAAAVAWKRALEHHDTADDLKQVAGVCRWGRGPAPRRRRRDGAEGRRGGGAVPADAGRVPGRQGLGPARPGGPCAGARAVGRSGRRFARPGHAILDPEPRRRGRRRSAAGGRQALRRLARCAEAGRETSGRAWPRRRATAGKYREALRRARPFRKALAVRDRAWAEGPYLAQCLLARLAVGKPDADDLRILAGRHRRNWRPCWKIRPRATNGRPSCRRRPHKWKKR